MTLDELERLANAVVVREGDVEIAVIPALITRLRATEALVERAYREAYEGLVVRFVRDDSGERVDVDATPWEKSDAKAALDALREGT